jgi:hypothetical protein
MEAERVSEPNGDVETNKTVARSVINPSFASESAANPESQDSGFDARIAPEKQAGGDP